MNKMTTSLFLASVISAVGLSSAMAGGLLASLEKGDVQLESIGPISFGPEGILFVADPRAAAIHAIDTGDRKSTGVERVDVMGVDTQIAAMLGVSLDELLINDMALNPMSGNTYLSVSRGRGPESTPVLVRLTPDAKFEVVELDGVPHSTASLWASPDKDRRGRDQRRDTITEIAYVNDTVVVAGLSNQEFSSRLRVIPFPFTGKEWKSGLEIYHTSHGKWETHSPIRTFAPFIADDEAFILAAHTCTPLVKMPLSALTSDADKVVGLTIAELGNRNRPLDMLIYTKEDQDWLLITNSARGVMKLAMNPIPELEGLTDRVPDKAGLEAEQISGFDGTLQIEACGNGQAVTLRKNSEDTLDLITVTLP